MPEPTDRKYSDTHEWHKLDGDVLTIGITRHAVDQLTDVTFVEMQPEGTSLSAGDSVGEVESVKTTSDVYCHVEGEIAEVNPALGDNPGLLNDDPYEAGWLVKVKVSDASGMDKLVDAETYAGEHAG